MSNKVVDKLKWTILILIVVTTVILAVGSCGNEESGVHSEVEDVTSPSPTVIPYHDYSIQDLKELSEYYFQIAKDCRYWEEASTYSNYAIYLEQIVTNKLWERQYGEYDK